eukprot:TRINITY_DN32602_c0_g1_i1.p1 TRINITY_DN32602_c0_g1~~TRINITY_DN32602_c0_g1_i1.p1  ORF type:complete len:253 (+),score=19.55 TRINITY_DN32602_c0_g1_i1:114-872(+)
MLNRVLPPEIQIVAWSPAAPSFNARFSCLYRAYRYYFVRGDRNLEVMMRAAKLFVGDHDFRNFCKLDSSQPNQNFKRRILSSSIEEVTSEPGNDSGRQVLVFSVVGHAFLWHQIRNMVSVLFMIGEGKEDIAIINAMLDPVKIPVKPNYNMASHLPLVLYDCGFEGLNWFTSSSAADKMAETWDRAWEEYAIRATLTEAFRAGLGRARLEDGSVWGQKPDQLKFKQPVTKHDPLMTTANLSGGGVPKRQRRK